MKHNKHNHNPENVPNVGPKLLPVHFEFNHPTALSVCVAGTFNNWQATTKSMHRFGNGRWLAETTLAPGTYEYCLVVDGQWMPDPRVRETVPNPFGGRNSVLKVANSSEAAHLTDAENLPLRNANNRNDKEI